MCWANWTWEQTCYLGAMSPQMSGRSTHKRFRKYGESSADQRSNSSPQKTTLIAKLIFRRTWMRLPMTDPTSTFTLSPDYPDLAGNQANQGTDALKNRVLLVALLWRNQHWFVELARLLTAAPWPIPLRWDLLSQANRTIWHPQPEL